MSEVKLLNHFGDDLMVINAARVSYGKQKQLFDQNDEKLMSYLVSHGHTSVFRHPQLQFRITCPIYVERQLFKHQVGMSANSISGRYVDFSDSYHVITDWRKPAKDSKQGSEGLIDDQATAHWLQTEVLGTCKRAYVKLLELGVCKEQARTILPLNLNTQFIWTGSLLAFIHFFKLRSKPDAQKETRDVAQIMLDEIKNLEGEPFKFSLKEFGF